VAWLRDRHLLVREPLKGSVAAVSVGIVDATALLDLDYSEDSAAQVDLNVVATGTGQLVEVQGTAEGDPFDRAQLDQLMDLALAGCAELTALQEAALAAPIPAQGAA